MIIYTLYLSPTPGLNLSTLLLKAVLFCVVSNNYSRIVILSKFQPHLGMFSDDKMFLDYQYHLQIIIISFPDGYLVVGTTLKGGSVSNKSLFCCEHKQVSKVP